MLRKICLVSFIQQMLIVPGTFFNAGDLVVNKTDKVQTSWDIHDSVNSIFYLKEKKWEQIVV
jgi:hypothetical protein